jgi:hypothetical protein
MILLASLFASQFLLQDCGLCSNEVISESSSPDKALMATSFVRNCGATTDFSMIVSVHRFGSTFRDDNDIVFVASGRGPLRLAWTGPRKLTIDCGGCPRKNIFKKISIIGDVDISY